MQVEIDINLLMDNSISADDYLALYALYRKGFKILGRLKLNPNWEELQKKGFVKLGDKIEEHIVRQEFIDLFASDFDQMFAELLVAYPMKVQTRQGMRILHANDPNAKANKKAKDRYRRVVGNKRFIHDKILKLLDKQLKIERGRLEYLQNLEVWINNHTWEKYSNIESDGGSSEENRITRRL
tara:strand:- start:322 stop:870 length:549 start_codon:yes stop_codon:yes gene_type:complete